MIHLGVIQVSLGTMAPLVDFLLLVIRLDHLDGNRDTVKMFLLAALLLYHLAHLLVTIQ